MTSLINTLANFCKELEENDELMLEERLSCEDYIDTYPNGPDINKAKTELTTINAIRDALVWGQNSVLKKLTIILKEESIK